jgi:hypothetical protein
VTYNKDIEKLTNTGVFFDRVLILEYYLGKQIPRLAIQIYSWTF